jgi:ubiquinone/menaquinone biosynthesis C-methylase UbiE
LDLLELRPAEHVLEIGFGPGWAIEQAAKRVPHGQVFGLDASATMLNDATSRNAAAIRTGQVQLQLGTEAPLPFANRTFESVFAVNSFQFWKDPRRGLLEVQRVLKTDGRLAITIQPMWVKTNEEATEYATSVKTQIVEAGFDRVHIETLRLTPLCFCIIGNN